MFRFTQETSSGKKIISAQQTKLCNTYKKTRLKLLKTKAVLWFNKMGRIKHLTHISTGTGEPYL